MDSYRTGLLQQGRQMECGLAKSFSPELTTQAKRRLDHSQLLLLPWSQWAEIWENVPKISRNVPKMSQSGHFETFSGHFTSKKLINVIKVSCTNDEQDLFKKPLKICFWLFQHHIIFCTIFAFLTHYVPATSSLKTLEGAWSSVKYRENYIIRIIT